MIKNNSIWRNQTKPNYEKFDGNASSAVTIIGGGIAGLLTAYQLSEKNIKNIVILEANKVGNATTSYTTAKITAQHNLIYYDLNQRLGNEIAKQYYKAHSNAIADFENIIHKHNIDCDFCHKPAYVYVTNSQYDNLIENELEACNLLGIPAFKTEISELPLKITSAIEFHKQAQFHPLKFIYTLLEELIKRDVKIYENSRVVDIEDHTVKTDCGEIISDYIVIATHFPICDLQGLYFAKMHQQRSYVLALSNAQQINGMYIDHKSDGYSFRNALYNNEEVLLFGGCSHKTGHEGAINHYDKLAESAKQLYPNCEIVAKWSTQDCMTFDSIPYIGKYSKHYDYIHVATGFNKWGMTSSMVSANIISEQIANGSSEFDDIFTPSRKDVLAQVSGFVAQTGDTIVNFAKGIISSNPRCKHMGCTLSWNEEEQTYDCPCHGSRYTETGEIICSPTTKNLTL